MFVCGAMQLGTGQGRGALAHSMESGSKESNINAQRALLSQNTLITMMLANSLRI